MRNLSLIYDRDDMQEYLSVADKTERIKQQALTMLKSLTMVAAEVKDKELNNVSSRRLIA